MVRLEKIKKQSNAIEAEFYPEGTTLPGFLSVDIAKRAITKRIDAPEYENDSGRPYVYHALYRLLELAEKDSVPEECVVMWY